MDRTLLEAWLVEGLSLEEIGRRVDRDPSTVGYWLERHGLQAAHRARHLARGALSREALEALIADGLSMRAIAERLGRSQSTVRHWLERYGLETHAMRRRRELAACRADQVVDAILECPLHGATAHRVRDGHGLVCLRCRSASVSRRRRKVKATLVGEAGGCCALCGYARCPAALEFHHLDPAVKSFSIAHAGVTRSLERAREEARKCVLLCANCHAEVEVGARALPEFLGGARSGVAQLADALDC